MFSWASVIIDNNKHAENNSALMIFMFIFIVDKDWITSMVIDLRHCFYSLGFAFLLM